MNDDNLKPLLDYRVRLSPEFVRLRSHDLRLRFLEQRIGSLHPARAAIRARWVRCRSTSGTARCCGSSKGPAATGGGLGPICKDHLGHGRRSTTSRPAAAVAR